MKNGDIIQYEGLVGNTHQTFIEALEYLALKGVLIEDPYGMIKVLKENKIAIAKHIEDLQKEGKKDA